MLYDSDEIKQVEYLVTEESGKQVIVLRKEDDTLITLPIPKEIPASAYETRRAIDAISWGVPDDGTDPTAALNALASDVTIPEGTRIILRRPEIGTGYRFTYEWTLARNFTWEFDDCLTLTQLTPHKGLLLLDPGFSGGRIKANGATLIGPQASVYHSDERGIATVNATAAIPVEGVVIDDLKTSTWGRAGWFLQYVTDLLLRNPGAFDSFYEGMKFQSAIDVRINTPEVRRILGSVSNNAYGIGFSRNETDSLITDPRSENCRVMGGIVEENPVWVGIDTHGGIGISFVGVRVKNCARGASFGSTQKSNEEEGFGAKDCALIGCELDAGPYSGKQIGVNVAGQQGALGTPFDPNENTRIESCVIRGYGIDDNVKTGGLYARDTQGLMVLGNDFVECRPNGILLYHDNYGFVVNGNNGRDVWSRKSGSAMAIRITGAFNRGVINGHVVTRSLKGSTPIAFVTAASGPGHTATVDGPGLFELGDKLAIKNRTTLVSVISGMTLTDITGSVLTLQSLVATVDVGGVATNNVTLVDATGVAVGNVVDLRADGTFAPIAVGRTVTAKAGSVVTLSGAPFTFSARDDLWAGTTFSTGITDGIYWDKVLTHGLRVEGGTSAYVINVTAGDTAASVTVASVTNLNVGDVVDIKRGPASALVDVASDRVVVSIDPVTKIVSVSGLAFTSLAGDGVYFDESVLSTRIERGANDFSEATLPVSDTTDVLRSHVGKFIGLDGSTFDPATHAARHRPNGLDPTFLFIKKLADQTLNNNTATQDDNRLVLPVLMAMEYIIDAFIVYSSSTIADIKLGFSIPTGASMSSGPLGLRSGAASASDQITMQQGDDATIRVIGGAGVGVKVFCRPLGILTTTTNNGNLQFRWAQSTLDPTDTVVYAGSWIRATPVI